MTCLVTSLYSFKKSSPIRSCSIHRFDLFGHFAVFFQEVLAHQVVLHTPAQVDGHVVIGIDGVNRQFLFLNALKVIGSVIHLTVKIIIGKGATSDSILTGGIYDKTDPPHPVQQSVSVMFQFIVQFIRIKRNDLIEVDLLAARQSADLAAILCILGTDQAVPFPQCSQGDRKRHPSHRQNHHWKGCHE